MPALRHDDVTAQLVGGIVLLFTDDVTDANRKAVVNSVLFAQLVASQGLSQEHCETSTGWHDAFSDALLRLGWPSTSFKFENRESTERTFSIGRQIMDDVSRLVESRFIQELVGVNIAGSVQRVFDSLETAASLGTDASRVYSQFHRRCAKNAFSVGIVTQDATTGVPILNAVAYEMNAEVKNLRVFFTSFNSRSVSMKSAHARLILNKRIYERIQNILEERLGDRVTRNVLDIPLTR